MNKLTDEEIVKALECCIDCKCKECPCYKNIDGEMRCTEIDEEQILDLIKRQKAEIKLLTEKLEALGDPLQDAHYKIAEQQAEIERLKARNDELNAMNKAASIEAIKEFAEKLKDYHKNYEGFCVVDDDDIDDLVAEMTEGRENDN